MRVGVVGVQGDVSEHVDAVTRAIQTFGHTGDAFHVRRREDLARAQALTIPGGESTAISKLLMKLGLFDEIVRRAQEESMPILGTCAGCILLAKEGGPQAETTETHLLGLMDMLPSYAVVSGLSRTASPRSRRCMTCSSASRSSCISERTTSRQ